MKSSEKHSPEIKRTDAQPPESFTGLRLATPAEVAGGLKAVISSGWHILSAMGPVRGFSTLLKMNQMTGFDCPGCAWPDPDDKRAVLAEYCENGAKAIAEEATTRKIGPDFFAQHSVQELAQGTDYWIGKQGRLTHPMIIREGESHYSPVSWEEAFEEIARELNRLDSPDEAVFYTSGRTSNEAAFLYQLFVRNFGTNNLPDCSNMCHESSGVGLSKTVGIGKGSVTMEDIHEAEVVMVIGQNPGTNHPRMLTSLQKCKHNGGKIITVNPLPEPGLIRFKHPQNISDLLGSGTQITDIFLQVKVNGDIAFAKALMLLLLEAEEKNPGEVFDREFIEEYTTGYEAFINDLQQYNLRDLLDQCGLSEEKVRQAANLLIQHDKIVICWAMGLTQHKNGVQNIQEMVNILLLKGAIGKPGAGTCPVRGHSNVQGDRTVGIWEKPKPEFLDRLEEHFGFSPPRDHGYNTVDAIEAMHSGKAKVFFAMGGNFLSATPDTEFTAEALRNCSLTVQVSTKLNRSHLIHGKTAIILPCLGRTEMDIQATGEQFVSVENSMGKVHSSRGSLFPASNLLRSEPSIVAGLAEAVLGDNSPVKWSWLAEDYDRIRDAIEACVPGFDQYNQRVREPGGFYLPNGARERKFNTADGKAHFTLNTPPLHSLQPGEYLMMTIRSHDQYNTTIYGLNDRYRGIFNERRVVLMNQEDMDAANLQLEEVVHLSSDYDNTRRVARNFLVVPFDIARGCVATYFPEANVLVPIGLKAEGSHTPASKSVIIRIEKS